MTESTVELRKCKTCGEEKPLTAFPSHNRKRGIYYDHQCRACQSAKWKKWYRDNSEAERAKSKARYAANPEKYREQGRKDYLKHRTRSRKRAAQRRAENLEHVRAQDREIAKRWRANHPFESRESARRRHAKKRQVRTAPIAKKQILELFDKQRGRCAICSKKLGKQWHIDHILPLAKGGAHEVLNFQLTCPPCNMSKKAEHPIDYMQKRGFLL